MPDYFVIFGQQFVCQDNRAGITVPQKFWDTKILSNFGAFTSPGVFCWLTCLLKSVLPLTVFLPISGSR